jgi:hypothetical protein
LLLRGTKPLFWLPGGTKLARLPSGWRRPLTHCNNGVINVESHADFLGHPGQFSTIVVQNLSKTT